MSDDRVHPWRATDDDHRQGDDDDHRQGDDDDPPCPCRWVGALFVYCEDHRQTGMGWIRTIRARQGRR